MMLKCWSAALILCLALAGGDASAAEPIGYVKTVSGAATIVRAAAAAAIVGAPVMAGDVIETGADGAIGITFTDGSTMALGPDSRLVMEDYSFDSAAFTGAFTAGLSQGTLVVDAGDIARTSPDAMQVTTPDAVLGVRGTTFAVKVEPRS